MTTLTVWKFPNAGGVEKAEETDPGPEQRDNLHEVFAA